MNEKPNITGDNAALRFLRWLRPGGPWVLTSIAVDRSGIDTRTFSEDNLADLRVWLEAHNGRDNCYFMVNPARGPLTKKAAKEDVEAMAFLHVDCDPPKGADIAASRADILARLQAFDPPPSAIIDSGGGYQGFWRLDEALYVGGNVQGAEDAELYNQQLGLVLKADNCHNCDRIMRLPGTVNLPDAKKRAAGRTTRLAEAVGDLTDATYSLSQFTPAPRSSASPSMALSAPAVQISGNLAPVLIDDLPEAVPQRIKMLIVQGCDPDEPTKYPSRSEVSWAITCGLLRAGCSDDTVASILLDADYAGAAHTRDQHRPMEYVARQIERARDSVRLALLDPKGRRVLDPADPFKTATRLRAELFPHIIHTNGDWLEYDLGAYRNVEGATMRSAVWQALKNSVVLKIAKENVEFVPFKPGSGQVSSVLDALSGDAHLPATKMAPPTWLNGKGPPPLEIVVLRNGLLHVPTGEFLPPTPRFFTRNALDLDFDADAPMPVEWIRFVKQVLPDPAAAALLQEWFGYLLLPDVSQQKIMLIVGPPRSGKGVIQHIITALVGQRSVCAPSSNSLAGTNVGALQPLIGATVAFLTDARFGGRADKVAITANLLAISGGDRITIDRKYKDPWDGVLAARLVIMTNELPGLRDNSPALANRFTPLILEQSFLGREDHGLVPRIIANEMPGVLNWAIEGWRQLHERGRFALPTLSEEAIAEILDLGSPVAAFVNARCALGEGKVIEKDQLYRAYRAWCTEAEQYPVALNVFGRDLGTATGGKVRSGKTRVGARDGGKVTIFLGIKLRHEAGPAEPQFGGGGRWEGEPY